MTADPSPQNNTQ